MRRLQLAVPFACFCLLGCTNSPNKPSLPVAPEKPRSESDLAFTNLNKEAYAKLGIKIEKAKVRPVQERLTLTGWIMAKPGHEVTLTAPVAGYVRFCKPRQAPIAGESVSAKHELLELEPVLSPVEKIQVASLKRGIESDLAKATTTLKTALSELDRVRELYNQKLKSKQEYEQSETAYAHAREEVAAAKDKLVSIDPKVLTLAAPQAGSILQLHASEGQYVPAAAPLITIIDLQPVWVRVPVQEFDLPSINQQADIQVVWKNQTPAAMGGKAHFVGKPVGRIAQVDPVKHTAELWYEIDAGKDASRFVKDLMVTVRLPAGKSTLASIVPDAAIIYDAHGQGYIYVEHTKAGEDQHRFERRKVEVVASIDGGLLIQKNLTDGERLVIDGAAKLFSREFHKGQAKLDDEDD